MNLNNSDWQIEICEMPEDKLAARTKIRMSALKLSNDDGDNNGNGINWKKDFVQNNLKSLIGAPYKVCFIDDNKTIPSGHGSMVYDDQGNVCFPDSDTVGTIMDAHIEDVEIDGNKEKLVVTQGYLFQQSYPDFVNWLKDKTNQGTIYGSIELNGKGDSKRIIYANGTGTNLDGSPKTGRQPQIFDFTAIAILSSFVPPADIASQVLELNSKNEDYKLHSEEPKDKTLGSFDDKKEITKKEEINSMDEKVMLELNQKITDSAIEINNLTTKNTEFETKVKEQGEVIVNANKTCEELNAKMACLTEELNACKTELDAMKAEKCEAEAKIVAEQKKAEVNAYFETEITKNGFADEEVNSLKVYIENTDLDGLKKAESELCTKKIKEMANKQIADSELNSKNTKVNFIALHEKDKKVITDKIPTFFN